MENSFNNTVLGNSIYDNENHGILLDKTNFTNIKSNSILNNDVTGIYLNNSLDNNITANTVDYHDYPIFLHRSNHTFVINNTGYGNMNDIKELDCDNSNYYGGNNFEKIIGIREKKDDKHGSSEDTIVVDFTIILFICISIFIFVFLTIKLRINKLRINKFIMKIKNFIID